MARGTKEFLSLLVELDWDSSLPLNTLLCLVKVLCRVQYGQQFVQGPSFCHCHQRVQLCSHYWASSPHQSVQSTGVSSGCLLPSNPQHKRGRWSPQTNKTSAAVFCGCWRTPAFTGSTDGSAQVRVTVKVHHKQSETCKSASPGAAIWR